MNKVKYNIQTFIFNTQINFIKIDRQTLNYNNRGSEIEEGQANFVQFCMNALKVYCGDI